MPELIHRKKFTNHLGFTLIELLVVISIIAILAVIGVAVFTGVTKVARDSKRRIDIDSIAKALEIHFQDTSCMTPSGGGTQSTGHNYCYLHPTFFSSGSVPFDPKASNTGKANAGSGCGTGGSCWYCVKYSTNPSDFTYCDIANAIHYGIDVNSPSPDNKWLICANLENSPGFYCKRSQQ